MRKVALAIFLSLYAVASVQLAAASHVETTGTQLSMYEALVGHCSFTDPLIHAKSFRFDANAPFFVRHGWAADLSTFTSQERRAFLGAATTFELYVDGVETKSIKDLHIVNDVATKLFVTNFPSGLTGTHEFRGWWFLDGLLVGGSKGAEVFQQACALQVSFG